MTPLHHIQADRLPTLKSGIDARSTVIHGEDRTALEALIADYYTQFPARNAVERYLVDTLVHCDWNRRRLLRVQAELYRVLTVGPDLINPLGYAWQKDAAGSDALTKVFRQLNAIDRNYFRAFNELRRLQPPPAAAEPGPETGAGRSRSPLHPTPNWGSLASFRRFPCSGIARRYAPGYAD